MTSEAGGDGADDFVLPAQEGSYVKLRVSPGAKSTSVKGLYGKGAVRLSVAAPPVDGKAANAEVERYLAVLVGVPASRVAIVKGRSSRDKLAFVDGAGAEAVRKGFAGLVRS